MARRLFGFLVLASLLAAGCGGSSRPSGAGGAALAIAPAGGALPDAAVGQPYSFAFSASGGKAPYGPFALVSGSLPPGITLDPATVVAAEMFETKRTPAASVARSV